MRQETLEEAFKKTYLGQRLFFDSNEGKSFEEGANWQAERMYSEEEVLELLIKCVDVVGDGTLSEKETDKKVVTWFNRFKKK
jgi:hypothetical protein